MRFINILTIIGLMATLGLAASTPAIVKLEDRDGDDLDSRGRKSRRFRCQNVCADCLSS
jgi:hypothetical protein